MDKNLSVALAGVTLKNPVMTASGTFGSGKEYSEYINAGTLGAVVTKGVSHKPWAGNKTPRVAEVYGGMLNSVGLQNPGVEAFIKDDVPFLKRLKVVVIVNVAGETAGEYAYVAGRLSDTDGVDMLELNISCPNAEQSGMAFGVSPKKVAEVVGLVKKSVNKPVIAKLSPNVTDITEIAIAAESAGADCLSMINTLIGMKIDIYNRRPVLANKTGGLSGPAIKPVAIRMVYQAARCVKIPIIGIGGICTGEDAVEFLMAGASAVAVGTASFMNPSAALEVLGGIERYMDEYGVDDVNVLKSYIR